MQRISKQSKRYALPKKSQTRIEKIVDLVKSPEFEFEWPEFLASEAEMEEPITDHLALKRVADRALNRLPPDLKRHLRRLMNNWRDELRGKPLNFEPSISVSADPLWARLPPTIQMFETGYPISLMIRRYQEIRRWREILSKIARRESGFYIGERITGYDKNDCPIFEMDELTRALNELEPRDWRKIRQCKKCGSIYLETRLTYQDRVVEPSCPPPAKCRQRIRQGRNARKPRPPSRLAEFRVELTRFCKARSLKPTQIENSAEAIESLADGMDFRPSTIKKCLEWIKKEDAEQSGPV